MSYVKQPNSNHYGNTTGMAKEDNQYQSNNTNSNYSQEPVDNNTKYKKNFFRYFRKFLPLMVTRGFQFASSSITLGTTAYARHSYGSGHHTKKQNFSVAVSAISVFYIIALYVILMFARRFIMPGAFFLCEVILCLLWLCAFIVLAKQHGQYSCSTKNASDYDNSSDNSYYGSNPNNDLYYNEYTDSYTNNSYSKPCKSSKASIAFAALCFALFALTSVLFYQFVMKPILRDYGTWKDIFKRANQIHVPGSENGVQLHRGSGLALTNEQGTEISNNSGAAYVDETARRENLEAGNNNGDQYEQKYNTYSTQETGAKTAGEDSYYEKEHQNQMQQQKAATQSIPKNKQPQYSGQNGTGEVNGYNIKTQQSRAANNNGAINGYHTGAAGTNRTTNSYQNDATDTNAATNGINGYLSNTHQPETQTEYDGYYSVNEPNEQSKTSNTGGSAQKENGGNPSLMQQAVDAGKKYMNNA